ncbi:MAG: HNH endonuclease [Muribaculaceae bacterium]|nr:HNH endonuclease [Muribaculaceae bacterium]
MKYKLYLKNVPISDVELKADVLRVQNLIAPAPLSSKKYDELGNYNSDTVARRFGKRRWNDAMITLGLKPAQVFHTEKDLFDNIAKVWLAKMAQPVRRDMDDHPASTISSGAYLRKYGRWNIALKKFIEYVESGEDIISHNYTMSASSHRTKREPSLRLKVQVLLRDGNHCKICGVKCDEGLHKLHFDHILPWSKGGETTLDNLRVLCKACNEALGNSNYPNE